MVLLRFNEEKKDWEQIDKKDKVETDIYLDGFLKEKLDFSIKQIEKDNDCVGFVCGNEGSGKSSLATTMMQYVSKNKFNPIKHIVQDIEHAQEVLSKTKKGEWIMFDEGMMMASSSEVLQKGQRDLVRIFTIIRQKNLFCLFVAPSIFRINSYFALDRTKFLVRTYTKNGERGYFSYWGEKKKAKLYRRGKAEHNYQIERPMFRGRFSKCLLLENDEYKNVKLQTLESAFKIAKTKKVKSEKQIQREFIKQKIMENPELPTKEFINVFGLSKPWICRLKQEIKAQNRPIPS